MVSTGRLSHVFCQLRDGEQGGIVSSSDAVFLQVAANIYIYFFYLTFGEYCMTMDTILAPRQLRDVVRNLGHASRARGD